MKNKHKIIDGVVTIFVDGGHKIYIDEADLPKVINHSWYVSDNGYACSNIKHKITKLHRFILDAPSDKMVDHKDLNKLNCRRHNIRLCVDGQNKMNLAVRETNIAGVKGVGWMRDKKKWRARIQVNGKEKHLGCFDFVEDAIAARLNHEKMIYGEFGNQC